jgi:hypothetical protein
MQGIPGPSIDRVLLNSRCSGSYAHGVARSGVEICSSPGPDKFLKTRPGTFP